jgi:putative cardiolipin synthase
MIPRPVRRCAVAALMSMLCACASLPPLEERAATPVVMDSTPSNLARRAAAAAALRDGVSGVRILDTGLDAFAERAALIEAAQRSIDAQYYIWNSDLTGRYLAERLYAAAERGVRVRLLLDDVNVAGRDAVIAALDSHPRLDVRIYNPFPERQGVRKAFGLLREFARLNRRMHNKSFTVDGAVAIIGGRNIGDEYFDAGSALNFRDRDVVAIGPVVQQVAGMFEVFWNSALSYPIAQLARSTLDADEGNRLLREAREARAALQALKLPVPTDAAAGAAMIEKSWAAMTWAPATLVHDVPPAPEAVADTDIAQPTARALADLALSAQRDVLIESAYLVMDDPTLAGIEALRSRGVAVRALTNSLASNDVTANHAAYARRRKAMLAAGIELWELRPDARACLELIAVESSRCSDGRIIGLHAKTFVFDRRIVYVGSLNLNLRSTYLNAETAMIIEHEGLADAIATSIEASFAADSSWRVAFDRGRVAWYEGTVRLDHEPASSWWRRTKSGFIALFPLEKYL